MVRPPPRDNWEKLVRATLKREQLRNAGQGHARHPSGIAGAVPPSLAQTTNVDLILQAADDIQSEDPNVARICKLSNQNFNFCYKCCSRRCFWTLDLVRSMLSLFTGLLDCSDGCSVPVTGVWIFCLIYVFFWYLNCYPWYWYYGNLNSVGTKMKYLLKVV
jgi:hypothetical protein